MKALYLFAASLQVDSVDENPAHGVIAADIAERSFHRLNPSYFSLQPDLIAGESDAIERAGPAFEIEEKLAPLHRNIECAVAGFRDEWRV